jgi:hypothetical protein
LNTGYQRKYAIRLLNVPPPGKKLVKRVRWRGLSYGHQTLSILAAVRRRVILGRCGRRRYYRSGCPGFANDSVSTPKRRGNRRGSPLGRFLLDDGHAGGRLPGMLDCPAPGRDAHACCPTSVRSNFGVPSDHARRALHRMRRRPILVMALWER